MEAFCSNFDLSPSNTSLLSKSFPKPTSKLIFPSRFSCSSCDKSPKIGLKVPQVLHARKFSGQHKNGGFTELKENLVRWVGNGLVGFAAAFSLFYNDSPALAESITVAFPVSHSREVTGLLRYSILELILL